nr:PREDICTED: uncharacterized protein LOC102347010 [Latimeria chalumnae]|eukprot:XP_006003428.2 PREDICTED: uncharacterized protein LOC102347010 [Latimeria chalumnae]
MTTPDLVSDWQNMSDAKRHVKVPWRIVEPQKGFEEPNYSSTFKIFGDTPLSGELSERDLESKHHSNVWDNYSSFFPEQETASVYYVPWIPDSIGGICNLIPFLLCFSSENSGVLFLGLSPKVAAEYTLQLCSGSTNFSKDDNSSRFNNLPYREITLFTKTQKTYSSYMNRQEGIFLEMSLLCFTAIVMKKKTFFIQKRKHFH